MIILFQLPWYSRTFINSNSTNSVQCDTLAHCAKRIRKWISESEMCHCANRIFSVTSVISHCAKRILIFFIGEHPLRKKNFQIWWSLRILRIFASLRKKNLSFDRIFDFLYLWGRWPKFFFWIRPWNEKKMFFFRNFFLKKIKYLVEHSFSFWEISCHVCYWFVILRLQNLVAALLVCILGVFLCNVLVLKLLQLNGKNYY